MGPDNVPRRVPQDHLRVSEAINRARAERLLDLSNLDLEEVPEAIRHLQHLEHLSLHRNNIRIIPDWLRELPRLKTLDIAFNPVDYVPDVAGLSLEWNTFDNCRDNLSPANIVGLYVVTGEDQAKVEEIRNGGRLARDVTALPGLNNLYVGLQAITHHFPLALLEPPREVAALIERLGDCEHLKWLTFFGLLLGEVPTSIRALQHLEFLHLVGAGIREIPDWISELRGLQSLDATMCELSELPRELGELTDLRYVFLSENRFSEFPPLLLQMRTLKRIGLRASGSAGYEGRIREVPAGILNLSELEYLDLKEQPVEVPPAEVVKEGVAAVKNYWRQREEAGIDYLCEAKLLLLGEGGAGKTSLAKKIENRDYQLAPGESSTEGIEITRWSFPSALHVQRGGKEALVNRDFRVNIWDFGGQEIYHATHQFFLTRRSVYALVADDRKEDTDFNYWLQVVELLSDGSPLLIVHNEKQDRRRDVNLGSLRARFPNLKEAYRVNLATNRGLDDLIRAIRQELERLPHIGRPLPSTWRKVREALEKDARDYIGLDEYLKICEEHGFRRRDDELQLSGYLHDLGICLHFQDDPVLKNTIILKPMWGTDAVYRVLDDHSVISNRGRFVPDDLARIWSELEYAPMRHELLRLMMRFQLCYELREGQAYIAPQLLSPTQPEYDWNESGNLVLRYEYGFMPKGLITRLIVTLNHLISSQGLVWKSGVILEREGTRAEVIEDYSRRKITLRIEGHDKLGLLAIVDDQIERIHRSFRRLQYERYLPCNCEVCQKRTEPSTYSLTELTDFARTGDKIQCRVSRKLVDAAGLIQNLFPGHTRFAQPEFLGRATDLEITSKECSSEPEPRKEVFVSYAWTSESTVVVDQLEKAFAGRGVSLLRDRNELKYKDAIRAFMQRIGRGKCIVVILSKHYLQSKNCMFELTEIADRGDLRKRVFPVILEDAHIYDAAGRLRYIKHWEEKKKELDAAMKTVSSENLEGIREEIDLFAKIRNTIARIVDVLADMNALTPEQHQGSNFKELLQTLEVRLTE